MGGKFHLKLNIGTRPIANKYCEGKMKSTLKRELKAREIVKREPIEGSSATAVISRASGESGVSTPQGWRFRGQRCARCICWRGASTSVCRAGEEAAGGSRLRAVVNRGFARPGGLRESQREPPGGLIRRCAVVLGGTACSVVGGDGSCFVKTLARFGC
jgi:hypothetical protein